MLFRVLNDSNKPVEVLKDASKLTAIEGVHSLVCRARQGVNSAMKYLSWIALGNFDLNFFFFFS
jgi:hypothetical protein